MKTMVCEMCGGNELVKSNGVYTCQHCGTKYDMEEARKLIVEVSGNVSVNGIASADNLMDRAQEFLSMGDYARASEYVERVLDIDAHNARAREMQRALGPVAPRAGTVVTISPTASGLAASSKSKMAALLLCILFGYFGAHCFYVGKFGKGVLYFFTMGVFGLGWIWDIIQILSGNYTDKYGLPVV